MGDVLAMNVTDEECLMASQQAEEEIDIEKNRFGKAVSESDVKKAVEAGIPPPPPPPPRNTQENGVV